MGAKKRNRNQRCLQGRHDPKVAATSTKETELLHKKGTESSANRNESMVTNKNNVSVKVEDINSYIEKDVRKYLNLIDELRTLGVEKCRIELPKIAVIGDQSSGKSSVLESLTGIQFPRGTGLVTRCATEVRMSRANNAGVWGAVVYTTKEPEKRIDLSRKEEIADTIKRLTETLCEPGCLSDESIVVELRSSEVQDLTIIDLPGLTRAKTTEQGYGFREAVESLVKKYVQSEQTINLCVVPANADIATAGSFQYAEEADPRGERTIGVLTKVDLIDMGTEDVNVVQILNNVIKPLKLGYVAVRNRGEQDLKRNMSIADSRNQEESFFKENPVYNDLIESGRVNLFGVRALAKKLCNVLVKRIMELIPRLKRDINSNLASSKRQLIKLGREVTEKSLILEFNRQIEKLKSIFSEATVGASYTREPLLGSWVHKDNQNDLKLIKSIRFYSSIYSEGFEVLQKFVNKVTPAFDSEKFLEHVKNEAKLRKGRLLPGYMNANLFRELASSSLSALKPGALDLIETTIRLLTKCVAGVMQRVKNNFPKFSSLVQDIASSTLEKLEVDATSNIEDLFYAEEIPFTMNKDFSSITEKRIHDVALKLLKKQEQYNLHPRNGSFLRKDIGYHDISGEKLLTDFLKQYWNHCVPHLTDMVIKVIDASIIRKFAKAWMESMYKYGSDHERLVDLMKEDSNTVFQRKMCKGKIDKLAKAKQALSRML